MIARLLLAAGTWTCAVCNVVVPNGQKHRCSGTLR